MPTSLRIARVDVGSYRLLTADFSGLQELHRELTAAIRRHLPATTASVLALPIPSADGTTVDWYSDLAGEAKPLASLPPVRRAAVKDKLTDRLSSMKRLADELPRRVRGSESLAGALQAATCFPGDEHVFAVGDEPVVTLWGFVRAGWRGRLATPGAAAGAARSRRRLLGIGLALLTIGATAAGGWLWWVNDQAQSLRGEVADTLESGCSQSDRLVLLSRRIQQFDPDGQRIGELRPMLAAEQVRCAEAEALSGDLANAGWDCAAITSLPSRLDGQDTGRAPFDDLAAEIAARTEVCEEARQFATALAGARGDCAAVSDLGAEIGTATLPEPEPNGADVATDVVRAGGLAEPLGRVRAEIDAELARCGEAEALEQELDAAGADCELLSRLDGRLAERDASRPPFEPLRARVDAGLALCERARGFLDELINAQQQCTAYQALDARMQGPEMRRPPLLEVREQLDDLLEACKDKDAMEQTRRDANGDCPRLAALAEEVRDRHGDNLLFVDLRRRIAGDTHACALSERLRAELAAATGDCRALDALAPRIEGADASIPALTPVRERLAAELALCEDAEQWRRRVAEAEGDCARVDALRGELPEATAGAGQFAEVRSRIETLTKQCRKAAAKAREAARTAATKRSPRPNPTLTSTSTSTPAATPTPAAKARCPGVRKKTEAPQLVMVFDASGSMGHGINASPEVLRQLQQAGDNPLGALLGVLGGALQSTASGPSRMQAAKDTGRRIVDGLPGDVDIGLVKIENCPAATDAGFYPPARRPALLARIGALQPRNKTPLASGVAKAASMVDGVRRPAVIAVISDGEDTCGGNVCAVAMRIARAQPNLKINVVDIAGTGAADCAARATGGRVLRAGNAAELGAQMQRATEEVAGPADCRRG